MIRLATPADALAVQAIYAPIVRDTAISFELEVPGVREMRRRINKVLSDRPWLIFEWGSQVLGYAYATTFRERAAYRWGTEVSIYVRENARGRGVGRRLYGALFDVLRLQGYCTAVAGATVPNEASEKLHASMGFKELGRYPAAGYKHDQWHDVAFWYLPLRALPMTPTEILPLQHVLGTVEFESAIEK